MSTKLLRMDYATEKGGEEMKKKPKSKGNAMDAIVEASTNTTWRDVFLKKVYEVAQDHSLKDPEGELLTFFQADLEQYYGGVSREDCEKMLKFARCGRDIRNMCNFDEKY